MTREEVIRMVLEATGQNWVGDKKLLVFERFAALVTKDEREKIKKLEAELDELDSRCTELLFEIKMIHGA